MNTITLELSLEDRARLDKLIALLETRVGQAEKALNIAAEDTAETEAAPEIPAEAPTEAAEPSVNTTEEEKPAEAQEKPATEEKPTVTLTQIQQKVLQLVAGFDGAKKAKVREIINAHAKKVSDLPENTWAEVWEKLNALEAE